tara:strand:- start:25535 stop:26350 length:816 start_codon:yes stop_codon:yes gene_type:complete
MNLKLFRELFINIFFDIKKLIKKNLFGGQLIFKSKKQNKDKKLIELNEKGVLKLKWHTIFKEDINSSYLFKKIKKQANRLFDYEVDANSREKGNYVIYGSSVLEHNPDPYLLALGNSRYLLSLVSRYFECPCFLYSADYWLHKPYKKSERISSQNWHRDPESKKMIKLFLIIKKVTISNGPTEFVKASHKTSNHFYLRNIFRNQTNTPKSFSQEKFFDNQANVFKAIGEEGEVVLMDTSGFHRGGFCEEDRLIANITYIPCKYSDGNPSWE